MVYTAKCIYHFNFVYCFIYDSLVPFLPCKQYLVKVCFSGHDRYIDQLTEFISLQRLPIYELRWGRSSWWRRRRRRSFLTTGYDVITQWDELISGSLTSQWTGVWYGAHVYHWKYHRLVCSDKIFIRLSAWRYELMSCTFRISCNNDNTYGCNRSCGNPRYIKYYM